MPSDEIYLDYAERAARAGCPRDQLENFRGASIVLQPKQLLASAAARACDHPTGPTEIGYGGARGGGKSHWGLAQMGVDDCQRATGLKCLLLRKVGKANTEQVEDLRRRLFSRLPHTFSPHRGLLTFANGSRIITGHFQKESDIDGYLGLEYDVILLEEATTLTQRKAQDIKTCLRTSKAHWRPRMYLTTNPGGVGHSWFKSRFVIPYLRGTETETRFIPARAADNGFNNAEYRKVLEGLSGWQKRAWADGDWDIASGQYFGQFRRDIHVREEIDDTLGLEWHASLDYGFTHHTAVYLGFKDGDGNFHVVDEHVERQWLPERHARAIKQMIGRHRCASPDGTGRLDLSLLRSFVAGADVFSKRSDGRTVAQQYAEFGIKLGCANTDRVHGWGEIQRRLGDPGAGIPPRLFIHARCARLIECLPNLQHDPHRPEDVLKVDCDEEGNGGDDPADALRYLVATKRGKLVVRRLRGL